jgi:hypothetical protein
LAQHRLLGHHAGRIGQGGDDAEHSAEARALGVVSAGQADQGGAGEGHDAANQQQAGKALRQQQPGQDGDEDRTNIDQHRGDTGVEVSLSGVQGHVVQAEPQQPAERNPR